LIVFAAIVNAGFPPGTVYNGDTTQYPGATGVGSCGFASTDFNQANLLVATMNAQQWEVASHCGECLYVTANINGVTNSVTVMVVDQAAGQAYGHLDLTVAAMTALGIDPNAQKAPINWTTVACPPNGGLIITTNAGSSNFYMEFLIKNHRIPTTAVSLEQNGFEVPLERTIYNTWRATVGNVISPPWNIKVTGSTGEIIYTLQTSIIVGTACSNQQFSVTNPTTGSTSGALVMQNTCMVLNPGMLSGYSTQGLFQGATTGGKGSNSLGPLYIMLLGILFVLFC